MADLSANETLRYSRQTMLENIGTEGQKKLKAASVLLVGLGGLGSPAALYLAAAGVGRLGLVDFDRVDLSNLHRQVLHTTERVGRPKTQSACETLRAINPHVELVRHDVALSAVNALDTIRSYDAVLDGADNFGTRYLVNDACVLLDKPDISGSVFQFEGQASVFWARRGPCYRCLHPDPPPPGALPSCAEAGVLGVLPGVVGLWQATETIKLIVGIGDPLIGRLLLYDALAMRMRSVTLRKDPACAICGENPVIRDVAADARFYSSPTTCQATPVPADADMDAQDLKARIDDPSLYLLDVRQPDEWALGQLPNATLIPLNTLPRRLAEIPADRDIVVYCHSGVRSRRALMLLHRAGHVSARHLRGGLLAWRVAVEDSRRIRDGSKNAVTG